MVYFKRGSKCNSSLHSHLLKAFEGDPALCSLFSGSVQNCIKLFKIQLLSHVTGQFFNVLVRQKPVAILQAHTLS